MTAASIVVLIVSAALAWAGTGAIRRYALRRSLLDVPNDRSSHTVPTPRGGGLAIAVVTLTAIAGSLLVRGVDLRVGLSLLLGGGAVAAAGWIDDRRSLSARTRLLVHLVAAAGTVAAVGGLPTITLGAASFEVGLAGGAIAIVAIVWSTNLYNFMDGIDGIAGGQGVVAFSAGAVALSLGGATPLATVSWVLAGACAGFLLWNWSPARIFMGDVGSGFLGFILGAMALAGERAGAAPAVLWVLFAAPFVFDATVTLLRRAVRGERIASAHRAHAYQRATQAGWSHRRTATVAIAVATVFSAVGIGVQRGEHLVRALAAAAVTLAAIYLVVERRCPMPRHARPRRGEPAAERDAGGSRPTVR